MTIKSFGIWVRTISILQLTFLLAVGPLLAQDTKPLSEDEIPPVGSFWSLQRTGFPPWPCYPPFLRELGAPVYKLKPTNWYLVDDSTVDYAAIQEKREEDRVLRKAAWQAGLLSDEDYWLQEGGSPAMMMMSSMASSFAYGNAVYLVDLIATNTPQGVTASFSIAGGTNNVPYDILRFSNIGESLTNWNWLGIGYTSNRYTFSNQPLAQAFYILAKPQNTLVVGWGIDEAEQCAVPPGLTNAAMVAGGGGHSLALLNDGTVRAWGLNNYGQGSAPTNLLGVTMVAAGWRHNVALLTNGVVTAWGLNGAGLGWHLTEVPPDLTNAAVVSAQALHSLALTSNGTVVAWGYNNSGVTNVPSGLSNVVAIAAGYQHNLVVKSDGTVFAWGNNTAGQCSVPAGLSNVIDVAAGIGHSLALKSDGTVTAWGGNTYGESDIPADLSNVVAIAAGGDPLNDSSYSLALKRDNTIVAWGSGPVVTPLSGMSNAIAIASGADHALAIRTGPRTPVITLQPEDNYQLAGGDVTFYSRGAGLYGVAYQWKTNGVNLANATNATFSLTNFQVAHEGSYTVAVSNEIGTITSPEATLALVTPPVILTQLPMPTNQVVIFREDLTLSVSASAPGQLNGYPLTYQWTLNGTNISGATTSAHTLLGDPSTQGVFTVTVANAAGSANASWDVTHTYEGSYVAPGTLAYHLATNAVGRAAGLVSDASNRVAISNWTYEYYNSGNLHLLTNSVWSTNFWLQGILGLSATSIGASNNPGGQRLVTMVSPRHYLFAYHVGSPQTIAFLDTNNVIHWRNRLQDIVVVTPDEDISVGILDEDLPPSVGFLPVVPTNLLHYLPTNFTSYVQGIGMNQFMQVFSRLLKKSHEKVNSWS